MKTFIQYDSTFRVTATLQSDEEQVPEFTELKYPIPEYNDDLPALFYNEKTGHCYFDKEPEPDKTELELLAEENTDLKSRLSTLEDTIMVLTMF